MRVQFIEARECKIERFVINGKKTKNKKTIYVTMLNEETKVSQEHTLLNTAPNVDPIPQN